MIFTIKGLRIRTAASLLASALIGATRGLVPAVAADNQGDGIGTAKFTTSGSVTNFSASAKTIPYFRSQFTDPTNGVTYAYTMVGTDPSKGNVTTTIPVVIIPVSFTFATSADPNFTTL